MSVSSKALRSPKGITRLMDLLAMPFHMLLLIAIWSNPLSDEPQGFQASFGGHMRARPLKVLGSLMPMGSTEGAEVELQLEVGCHGVRGMHFGGPKEVVVPTFISAEKFGAREGGPNLSHAFHVKGTLKKGKVSVQGQNHPTSNAGILRI